jgi:hypothetical protein
MAARQHAAAFVFFLLLSVAMTWPLARNLDRAVAWPGDPYINTWILDWDWYATFHHPLHLFEANAFYPARDSLAFSENLYGIALVLFPFRAAGLSPIAAHNLAILLGFTTSGFAAYLLGRHVSRGSLAGVVSGIFYAFVPFRFTHLTHVQHVWGGTLPLLILALLWYAEKPAWWRASLFGAAFLFNALCNIHWLLFGTVAVAITIVIVRPRLIPLAACTGIAALFIAAFLHPYWLVAKLYGMERSAGETLNFSATWSDWLVASRYNRFYASLHDPSVDAERWLFPGALALLIGGVGLLSTDRKSLRIAASWIVLGLFGSFGLNFVFHELLFTYVPGFRAIRVPARWAAIAYVGLAMLVALGTAMIARRRQWVYALVAIAFVVELRAAPILWYMALPEVPGVEAWIRQDKPRALVELPMRPDFEYWVMLRATAHHRPMVNGISGFGPPEYERIRRMAQSASDAFIPELQRIGVTHIVVHADAFGDSGRAWLARALQQRQFLFIQRFDARLQGDWLFAVSGNPRSSPDLEEMLRGGLACSDSIAGGMFSPPPQIPVGPNTTFDGIALSPYGIRRVNLLVNNGDIRLTTNLRFDPTLSAKVHGCSITRFTARFARRPPGVWKKTDVQPEIIDGRGSRMLLEDRWIVWQ